MSEQIAVVPACPGCHFGCSLDAYRCGRGKAFSERWCEGAQIPERGVPPMMRDGKQGPPPGMRVMHGLSIVANKLQDRHAESADRKVLASIERQGGFFAIDLLGKRTLVGQPRLDQAVASLVAENLADLDEDPVAGAILRITEEGRARQREWNAERDAATAEFLAPLTEDEQGQLAHLLFKLLRG